MTTIRVLCTICCVLSLAGCSKENDESGQKPNRKEITFDASITEKYAGQTLLNSRAASYIEGSEFAVGDQIGVLGYTLPGGSWTGTETPALMYNAELSKIDTETFRYNPMVPWPLMGKASFFAYYPYSRSVTQGVITPSSASQAGYPTVKVVLGKSHEPIDFMTAQKEQMDYASSNQGAIRFKFGHRLSKLFFQAKFINGGNDVNLYINTIKIRNIYNKAVYVFMDAGAGNGAWTDYGNESTPDAVSGATLSFNSSSLSVGNDYTDLIMPSQKEAYALMLPQTYSNTELEIGYILRYIKSDGGCEYMINGTKTLPMSVNWEMGQVYTYRFEFAFSEILGIDVKVDVLKSDIDWDRVDIGTDIGK